MEMSQFDSFFLCAFVSLHRKRFCISSVSCLPNYSAITALAALAIFGLLAASVFGFGKCKGPLKPQAVRKKAVSTKAIRARIGAGAVGGRIGILAWQAQALGCQNSVSFKG